MTADDIRALLTKVEYPGFRWIVPDTEGRIYLQAQFVAACSIHGVTEQWSTRKWYLSNQATESEIVQTALKLTLTAAEHEVRENFKYRGRPIFGPHMDIEALHTIAEHLDLRAPNAALCDGHERTPA